MKLRIFASLIAVMLVACTGTVDTPKKVESSTDPAEFSDGKLIMGELKSDSEDVYEIELQDGQFVSGNVNQITVDVVVEVFDPAGELAETFDNPARGPEHFQFETELEGVYEIKVTPFEEEEGNYSIILDIVEAVANNPEDRIDQILSAFTGEENPGAVVGVIRNGELEYIKSYGSANLTHNLAFEANTPTNIGSVSKQFTAFAILMLEKEGKLSLDDDIRKHMPEFKDFGETITIKNLLNHTNGLREIYNIMPMTGWRGEDGLLRSEALKIVQRQPELQASPGEEYNYNNTAFILAAQLVEDLTDQTFPEWMQENIFEPLGMMDTRVRSNPAEIIPGASMGYSSGENGMEANGDLYAAYGAGGIYTTPADFAKWLGNFNDPKVGGAELIDKLTTRGILNNGDTLDYGLGIGVTEFRGLKRFQHGGADIAHRAALHYYPEIDAGVVALSNNGAFPSGRIANQLAEAFLNEDLEPEEVEVEPVNEGEYSIAPELVEEYAGKYKAESIGLVIEYKNVDGTLEAHPTGQGKLAMDATSDTTFNYDGVEATIVFRRDESGEVTSAVHTQGGNDIELVRLPPYDPTAEDLKVFEGRYFSEELETFYSVELKEDQLIVSMRNWDDIELTPTEENTFAGSEFFIGEMKFNVENGVSNSFEVSNGRTKGVKFVRFNGLK